VSEDTSSISELQTLLEDLGGRPVGELFAEVATVLGDVSKVLITGHMRPDGDAYGSEAALACALLALGKSVRVVNDAAPSTSFRELLPSAVTIEAYDEAMVADLVGWAEACVLLDTSEPERAGLLEPLLRADDVRTICVDHHVVRGEYPWDIHVVARQAPATGCLVVGLIDALGVEIDREMATALWLAIVTDTGWFRFANTDPIALACGARLVGCGITPESLWRRIYGSHTAARTRALGRVLQDVQCRLDGRLVWSVITRRLLREHSVGLAEMDGIVDHLKSVGGVEVAALVSEVGDDEYKVSLRSLCDLSVETIARGFGGGGHEKASGYRFSGALTALVAELETAVEALDSAPAPRSESLK